MVLWSPWFMGHPVAGELFAQRFLVEDRIAAGMEEGLREIGQFSTIVMRLATSLDEEQDQGMFSQLGMLLRDLHEAIEEDRGKLFRLLHPWPEGRLMGDHQAEGGVA